MSWAAAGGMMGSGAFSYFGQREANRMNRDMSREQMQFQERMSSTRHQREVKDLKAAGLNPILSASGGASSPGGASPHITSTAEGASSSAAAMPRMLADLNAVNASTNLTKANTIVALESGVSSAKNLGLINRMKHDVLIKLDSFLRKTGASATKAAPILRRGWSTPENNPHHVGGYR